MHSFEARLVSGTKPPYDTWTFVVVPDDIYHDLGQARPPVRGTIGGISFRETINRSGGVPKLLVRRQLIDQIDASKGDLVEVVLELDSRPRTFEIPQELQLLFDGDPELAALYSRLAPSLRRAWAIYVAEAKRSDTRLRRAERATRGIREKLYPNQ